MKKLWSPWRSEYIDSFNKNDAPGGCIFCDALKQEVEGKNNLLVHKSNLTFTLLNLYPYNNGHLMIVPNRHIDDLGDLTVEESNEINFLSILSKHARVWISFLSNPVK